MLLVLRCFQGASKALFRLYSGAPRGVAAARAGRRLTFARPVQAPWEACKLLLLSTYTSSSSSKTSSGAWPDQKGPRGFATPRSSKTLSRLLQFALVLLQDSLPRLIRSDCSSQSDTYLQTIFFVLPPLRIVTSSDGDAGGNLSAINRYLRFCRVEFICSRIKKANSEGRGCHAKTMMKTKADKAQT